MIKLIVALFVGCWHKWRLHEKRNLTTDTGATGTRVILQCERCGDFRKRDLI